MSVILDNLAVQMGMSPFLLGIILIWSGVWKLFAMWKSARKNSIVWFIVFAITNTLGILPILYIYIFSKKDFGEKMKKRFGKKKIANRKTVRHRRTPREKISLQGAKKVVKKRAVRKKK